MCIIFILTIFVFVVMGEDAVARLRLVCPDTDNGSPTIAVTSTSPAHVVAHCQNGDVPLTSSDHNLVSISGRLDQTYAGGNCLFDKDGNVYSIQVEVLWGSEGPDVIQNATRSVSCHYNTRGTLEQPAVFIDQWYLNPWSAIHSTEDSDLTLTIRDTNGRELTAEHLKPGQTIQLVIEDKADMERSFRVTSCRASNDGVNYYILISGCGDGHVINQTSGFKSADNQLYSPFFTSFHLPGNGPIHFRCTLSVCNYKCGKNSRRQKRRKRRSILDILSYGLVAVSSGPVFLSPLR